jgi:hypothetical protein
MLLIHKDRFRLADVYERTSDVEAAPRSCSPALSLLYYSRVWLSNKQTNKQTNKLVALNPEASFTD